MKFNLDEQLIASFGATYTINEIYQQPECWKQILQLIKTNETNINNFFNLIAKKNIKYIFTGSGTSEFIGNALVGYFLQQNINIASIAATDILSCPSEYFKKEQATVLISFARSGNSPESVATVNLGQKIISDFYQIIITCNKDGALYQQFKNDKKALVLLLPEATNDQSFAMTSSYSSMLLTALLVLTQEKSLLIKEIDKTIANVNNILNHQYQEIKTIAELNHERIVFLGANILQGYAQESALKTLELSAGKVVSTFNSPLGFRHGPKSIVNQDTVIFLYLSSNQYTRKYDLDLLKELFNDQIAQTIVVFDNIHDDTISKYCHYYLATSNKQAITNDIVLGLQYVTLAQMFALFKALYLKNKPDNPCPTGEVNRVVKGVTIHSIN